MKALDLEYQEKKQEMLQRLQQQLNERHQDEAERARECYRNEASATANRLRAALQAENGEELRSANEACERERAEMMSLYHAEWQAELVAARENARTQCHVEQVTRLQKVRAEIERQHDQERMMAYMCCIRYKQNIVAETQLQLRVADCPEKGEGQYRMMYNIRYQTLQEERNKHLREQ